MGYYEIMQVCKKGHLITDNYNSMSELRQDFCDKCGSETIFMCLKCKTPIRGDYVVENVFGGGPTPVPYNCYKCGEAYPWKKRLVLINSLKLLFKPIGYLFELIVKIASKIIKPW